MSLTGEGARAIDCLRQEEQMMGRPCLLIRATRSTIVVEGKTREVWFLIYEVRYESASITETRWAVYVDGKCNSGGIIR